jgi:hypothetical protein
MKHKEREMLETVLPQCRTLYDKLWDEYLDAGAPGGCTDKALTDWIIETKKPEIVVERGKGRR